MSRSRPKSSQAHNACSSVRTVSPEPDFHVVSLRYKLCPSDQVTYVGPPPVEFDTNEVRFRLADGKLICEMDIHVSTSEEARTVVEPVLKAWEADADLRWNRGELRFEFDGADVIDRSPLLPGVIRGYGQVLSGVGAICGVGTVSVHVTRAHYPEPPGTFRLSPDAESIWLRYQGYLDGREPLLSMAYFCLTVFEANGDTSNGGKRAGAGATYRIDKAVLGKMGELTSCRGDRTSARKATAGLEQSLTGPEGAWLEAVLKALIRRLGDTRDKTTLPLITLADLPSLQSSRLS